MQCVTFNACKSNTNDKSQYRSVALSMFIQQINNKLNRHKFNSLQIADVPLF